MEKTYFTEADAHREIGNVVQALSDFPAVSKGSKGTVIKAIRHAGDEWAVVVEWKLPRERSFIAATVMDMSVNFLTRSRPVADLFSRSEYESLVRVFQPENRS